MLKSLSTNKICLSLDAWIIQSGERYDIEVNQVEEETAFEFSAKCLEEASIRQKNVSQIKHSHYQVTGEVVFRNEEVMVIDVGFFIFQNNTDISLQKGDWCAGEVYLGVDPFPTNEYFKPGDVGPNIYYDLRIDKIFLDETPFITEPFCEELGLTQTWVTRDKSKEKFTEVTCTDAKRRGPFSKFIIECTLLKHSVFET